MGQEKVQRIKVGTANPGARGDPGTVTHEAACELPRIARPLQLRLLGGFTLLKGGEEIELPMSVQRLVAFLALHERPLSRAYLAGVLWPDCSTERSLADLRTALWRANRCDAPVITAAGMRLCLRADVQVDVRTLRDFGRTVDRVGTNVNATLAGISWLDLSLDLLPDWYDDWLVDDREGVRQLRLHALERVTGELSLSGRHVEAIQAALAAVRLEPLRETAHAALIKAHLAEGNRSEALRQFYRCRDVLAAELAVEPSAAIRQLISSPPVHSGSRLAG
jgi:DNA-binding SARP family transcriptional activator